MPDSAPALRWPSATAPAPLDCLSQRARPGHDHPDAVIAKNKKVKWFSCLITDDHKMKVGDMTFWDWEDDEHYKNKF